MNSALSSRSLAARTRPHTTSAIDIAASGDWRSTGMRSRRSSARTRQSPRAVASALRALPSSAVSSPNSSPGPTMPRSISRPQAAVMPIRTRPSTTAIMLEPASPRPKIAWPDANRRATIRAASRSRSGSGRRSNRKLSRRTCFFCACETLVIGRHLRLPIRPTRLSAAPVSPVCRTLFQRCFSARAASYGLPPLPGRARRGPEPGDPCHARHAHRRDRHRRLPAGAGRYRAAARPLPRRGHARDPQRAGRDALSHGGALHRGGAGGRGRSSPSSPAPRSPSARWCIAHARGRGSRSRWCARR